MWVLIKNDNQRGVNIALSDFIHVKKPRFAHKLHGGMVLFPAGAECGILPTKTVDCIYTVDMGHICPSSKLSRIDELNMDVYVFLNKIVYCLSVAIVVLYWLCPHHFRVQTTRLHEIIVMT